MVIIYMNVAYANEYLRETTDEKLGNRGVGDELKMCIRDSTCMARGKHVFAIFCMLPAISSVISLT